MPTQSDKVQLLVGGRYHDDWDSYEIDSDLRVPADAWSVKLGMKNGAMPPDVVAGAAIEVRVGGDTVLTGRIDDVDEAIDKRSRSIGISGRDGAAVLVDCAAPIFAARLADLDEIVAKVVRPLGVKKIRIEAANPLRREKVNVEPGDTAWHALANAAEANGLWPWFEPDGTLVVGGPDYSAPPVATLVMRTSGKGNNVLSVRRDNSVRGRYSEVTVLGQAHGTAHEQGRHNIQYTARDTGMQWYRPRVVVDHECDSVAVCEDRARKLLADSRLDGFGLAVRVKGHRINAKGMPGDGRLWTPGMRVRAVIEPYGIDDVFFLMARRFEGGRDVGAVTDLTLKEDGAWVLDAHPHKRKHRRGKNDATGQIIDASKGAS